MRLQSWFVLLSLVLTLGSNVASVPVRNPIPCPTEAIVRLPSPGPCAPSLGPTSPCPPGGPSPTPGPLDKSFKFQDLTETECMNETLGKGGKEAKVSVCLPAVTMGSAVSTILDSDGLWQGPRVF